MDVNNHNSQKLRISLIGVGPLLKDCAKFLVRKSDFELIILKPDRPNLEWARRQNVKIVMNFEEVLDSDSFCDYLLSINNPQILSDDVLDRVKKCALNYHNSLLPGYAGINASTWAILNNEKNHGVTWHFITSSIDAGDIVLQKRFDISNSESAFSLNLKCYDAAKKTFKQLVDMILAGVALPRRRQDLSLRSYYSVTKKPKLAGLIDFSSPAINADRLIRALNYGGLDNPVAIAKFIYKKQLWGVSKIKLLDDAVANKPGVIVAVKKDSLIVVIGQSEVELSGLKCLTSLCEPVTQEFKVGDSLQCELFGDAVVNNFLKSYYQYESYWLTQLNKCKRYKLPQFIEAGELETIFIPCSQVNYDLSVLCKQSVEKVSFVALLTYLSRIFQKQTINVGLINLSAAENAQVFLSRAVPFFADVNTDLHFKDVCSEITNQLSSIVEKKTFLNDLLNRYGSLSHFSSKGQFDLPVMVDVNKAYNEIEINSVVDQFKRNLIFCFTSQGVLIKGPRAKILSKHFRFFCAELLKSQNLHVSNIDLVPPDEKLFGISRKCNLNSKGYKRLHDPFLEAVRISPNNIALINERVCLTYLELFQASASLAQHLAQQLSPSSKVAIRISDGSQRIIACIACSMSNMIFIPISNREAKERQRKILLNCKADILIDDEYDAYDWDKSSQTFSLGNQQNLLPDVSGDDLAYIIHTSGSTGLPKGVMITHHNALNTILDINHRVKLQNTSLLALSDLSFDLAIYDIFGTLAQRGKIVVPSDFENYSPSYWYNLMEEYQVEVWDSAPALMEVFWKYCLNSKLKFPATLRYIMLSGDYTSLSLARYILENEPQIDLYSLGGATEASIWSICYLVNKISPGWKAIPYGKPLSNQSFYILDDNLQPLPVGVEGELFIGGSGVGMGYWNDGEKTKYHFITHPSTKEKLYRTGDKGYFDLDGNIIFCGRVDRQVKVHGVRIELGEIEQCLAKIDNVVSSAVILTYSDAGKLKKILGFIQLINDKIPNKEMVRLHIVNSLPISMYPDEVFVLDKMPINENGKIDRNILNSSLGKKVFSKVFESAADAKMKDVSNHLVKAVAMVLEKDVGCLDFSASFQQLGGTSLDALNVIALLNKEGLTLRFEDFFASGSLYELSQKIEKINIRPDSKVVSLLNKCNLKPAQAGILYACQRYKLLAGIYILSVDVDIDGQLDIEALQESLNNLFDAFPYLSACFSDEDFTFSMEKKGHVSISQVDLTLFDKSTQNEQLGRYSNKILSLGMVCSNSPLIRVSLFKVGVSQYRLKIFVHHVLLDGLGTINFVINLFSLYQKKLKNELVERPAKFLNKSIPSVGNELNTERQHYWRKLYESFVPVFNQMGSTSDGGIVFNTVYKDIKYPKSLDNNRLAPVLYASSVKPISNMCGSDDVSFGVAFSAEPMIVNPEKPSFQMQSDSN